jgi:CyaY protein
MSDATGDADFETLSQQAMDRLRATLEDDPDLDVEEKGDGVIEVAFDNGAKIIINRHGAAREIWVAARSGGFHFRWDGKAWTNTRDGSELFSAVARLVEAQRG